MENASVSSAERGCGILGAIGGGIAVVAGMYFLTVDFSLYNFVENASFGADFYTYTYGGIYAINENIARVMGATGSLFHALAWLLIVVGIAMIAYFLKMAMVGTCPKVIMAAPEKEPTVSLPGAEMLSAPVGAGVASYGTVARVSGQPSPSDLPSL